MANVTSYYCFGRWLRIVNKESELKKLNPSKLESSSSFTQKPMKPMLNQVVSSLFVIELLGYWDRRMRVILKLK